MEQVFNTNAFVGAVVRVRFMVYKATLNNISVI